MFKGRLQALLLVGLMLVIGHVSAGSAVVRFTAIYVPVSDLSCVTVSTAFAKYKNMNIPAGDSYMPWRCLTSGSVDKAGLLEVNDTVSLRYYTAATGVFSTLSFGVSQVFEPAPDVTREIDSYSVSEVVVFLSALLAFAVGFRTGLALI